MFSNASSLREKTSLAASGVRSRTKDGAVSKFPDADNSAKARFKSVGLVVEAADSDLDSSDSDAGNNTKKGDNLMLDSAKFMRNLTKVTNGALFQGLNNAVIDEDSDDDIVQFGTEETYAAPGGGQGSPEKKASYAKDKGLSDMLEGNLDFDLDIDDDGAIIDNHTRQEEERQRRKEEQRNAMENTGTTLDSNGSGEDYDNMSESGSEIEFGGDGAAYNEGVPMEKYKALEMRLVAVVKKVKESKKEYKDMRRKFKKIKTDADNYKSEAEELKNEVEELDVKLTEAYSQQSSGGGVGGGGGGAGGAALEEQRRKQREEARKALFAGGAEEEEEDFHVKLDDISFLKDFIIRATKYINKRMPLAADIRTVQGHFGSSVASFFSFYRWIIISNIWAGVFCLVGLVLHLYRLLTDPPKDPITGQDFDPWSNFMMLPSFMATSSYDAKDKWQYLALVVILPMSLFYTTIRKWIYEDGNSKIITSIEAEQANIKFAKQFLCCWDHGLTLNTDVEDLICTIGSNMSMLIAVEQEKGKTLERTFNEKLKIYTKRSIGILLYICLILISWALIIYLKAQSAEVAESLSSYIEGASYISGSIVPGSVTVINIIVPVIIDKITAFESWDSEKTVQNVLLMKMYLAKILMVIIQFVSNLFLGDPIMFTSTNPPPFLPSSILGYEFSNLPSQTNIRANLETPFVREGTSSTNRDCRLNQVGASFFQIVAVDFVLSKVIAFGISNAMTLKAKLTKKDFKREEFTVSKKMVSLLYFQGLVFLTITYAPLCTFFILIFQYSSFKFEKFMLFKYGTKPKKEWKAQDAGNFFIKFYLFTIIVTGLMSLYFFLSATTHAKDHDLMEASITYCSEDGSDTCTVLNSTNVRKESNMMCGPFTNETSAWAMVQSDIASFNIIFQILYQVVVNPLIILGIVLIFYLKSNFIESSLGVATTSIGEKERAFESAALTSERTIKKLNNKIKKLELAAQAAGED